MKALSLDLRRRILEALTQEPSSLLVSARFSVSASAVRKLRLKMLRTGSFDPGISPGRERLVKAEVEERLAQIVQEFPDATLNVLREMLEDETGVAVSETTMWRQLRRMGITLKKKPFGPQNKTVRT